MQGHVRRGGGPGDGGQRPDREWDLAHKGDLKEFGGDKKGYRPWTKKVQAFCNTKKSGFRKALLWAAKVKEPITQQNLVDTQWDHIDAANTKLYDLLVQICSGEALTKIETTPGEEAGFEAWRRLARLCEPTSRLTRIDRLNMITHTTPCSNMRE